ncbi:MAG: glycerophosphodiester phosphodiesterase [Cyanomargarita calcarea GSE-NOS-MK-12-04C]|jgi:glycerophosphoryl diester phosphodiesterase|uniref:glycerophosphodiester phosphodiesterase n=1 Tax=Cyanomargarita calcarea GSE-NOS-MK-12-04C TaxID=2839659 RepID=A0A951QJY7_9CYAN|nr:glycerophosphodiester phosphodiesterase [Cyanomargarita calcarea GSE-NOS-MK-12-04C]
MDEILKTVSPIIIGHRGASGYRPEHTLAAYELAVEMGADYIEPDLVSTQDGVLIARHENEISETTDIANHPEFAHRKTAKSIDGISFTGWFTEDFTLAELKTLRVKERIPEIRPQNSRFDGLFEIPTFQEVINLAKRKSMETGRTIGIYPETKHPSYFKSIDLGLEEPLLMTLQANGYNGENAPVFIQSFEVTNLKQLATKSDLPLVQLISDRGKPYDFIVSGDSRTYEDLLPKAGLREISEYARAIGVNKNLILTQIINDAHAVNLLVHAWTFRNEDCFLPLEFQGNPQGEYERFFRLGIDGVFSDNPDTARRSLD